MKSTGIPRFTRVRVTRISVLRDFFLFQKRLTLRDTFSFTRFWQTTISKNVLNSRKWGGAFFEYLLIIASEIVPKDPREYINISFFDGEREF